MLELPDPPPGPEAGGPRPERVAASQFRLPAFWLASVFAVSLAVAGGLLSWYGARWLLRPDPDPLEILERVRAEVIPAEDSPTGYGPAFNDAGYQTLLDWNRQVAVQQGWAADFESLDLTLPCCAFSAPSADEAKNCGCGHHQALYGLSKHLLMKGYGPAETQVEIEQWAAYMFPRERLEAELERRALTDPAMERALEQLRAKGVC